MGAIRLVTAVIILAGLDVAGTLCLKEAALRRSPALAIAGVALFVVLAGAVFVALEVAELTIVSLGWIVAVQLAVMVADRVRYDVVPSRVQAIAIGVALLALVVAALAPALETREQEPAVEPPAALPPMLPQQREPGPLEARLKRMVAERNDAQD